jgi:hypothetical protein
LNAVMSKRERIAEKRHCEKNLKPFEKAKELRLLRLLSAKIEITLRLPLKECKVSVLRQRSRD